MSPTPQTPPTDRPLTAGDWTENPTLDKRICRICDGGPGNEGVCLCGAHAYEAVRPETSAASEGAVDRVMAVLNHWFDGRARIDRNSDMVAQLAALASPPVSERERELEGALWAMVEHFERVDGDKAHKAVIKRATTALTAQPAGEGK